MKGSDVSALTCLDLGKTFQIRRKLGVMMQLGRQDLFAIPTTISAAAEGYRVRIRKPMKQNLTCTR